MSINTQALTWRELLSKLNDLPQEVLDKPVVFYDEISDKSYEISQNGGLAMTTPCHNRVPDYTESVVEYRAFVREVM